MNENYRMKGVEMWQSAREFIHVMKFEKFLAFATNWIKGVQIELSDDEQIYALLHVQNKSGKIDMNIVVYKILLQKFGIIYIYIYR